VIITTKNEEKNIENCLISIRKQNYPTNKLEIIVVDNNSEDKTKEIASKYTDKVFDKGPERSAQRNLGVGKANGEYFLYLDADMILTENVINQCSRKVADDKNIVGLYLPEIVMGDKFFSKVRRFERTFYNGTVVDCARFIKKSAFNKVGGFDLDLTGPEDWDLDKKLKKIGKVDIIKAHIDHNESEFNLKQYLKKKAYYSQKFNAYIKKWGKNDPDIRKQFSLWYRYFGIFWENEKWKKLFLHPLLTAGMYFLRILVGVKFLTSRNKKDVNFKYGEGKENTQIITPPKADAPMAQNITNEPDNSTRQDRVKILVITPFFRPNIGGAETYVHELCESLRSDNYVVNVLTYQPINSSKLKGQKLEKTENLTIRRYQWIGFDLFHKFQNSPVLVFLYITPYLFVRSFFWMLKHHKEVDLIDAQGFNAGIIARILKKIFRKKAVVSVMSLYSFQPGSMLAKYVNWTLKGIDLVIVEKGKSKEELISIGVDENKFVTFNQWIDGGQFIIADKNLVKKELGWENQFVVLFVGRANPEKGAVELVKAADLVDKNIQFYFITDNGPVTERLKKEINKVPNAHFVGPVDYEKLHKYYQGADIFSIPSQYEEGVARVIPEAISCGTPIVGSNMGSIPYVLDESVAILVEPTDENLARKIQILYSDRLLLQKLTDNCSQFAEDNFTVRNIEFIKNGYKKVLLGGD